MNIQVKSKKLSSQILPPNYIGTLGYPNDLGNPLQLFTSLPVLKSKVKIEEKRSILIRQMLQS